MSRIAQAILASSAEELLEFSQMLVDSYSIGVPAETGDGYVDATAGDMLEFLFDWARGRTEEAT